MSRSFSLSWARFSKVALVLIALPALFLYSEFRAGDLDITAASVPLLCISSLAFVSYRWSQMRRDFAAGKLTEADFRENPRKIVIGRPLHAVLWFCCTLLLVFLPVAWWAYSHWPAA